MRRGLLPLLAVMLAPIAQGCDRRCSGPACEDAWPLGRLAIHRGGAWEAERSAWGEATAVLDGTEAQGSDWSVAAADGRTIIGMPEADTVALVEDPDPDLDEQDATARVTWSAGPSEFGAAVIAVGSGGFDLWVGAPGAALDRGAVHRFARAEASGDRTSSEADLTLRGWSAGDRFGERLAGCGDLTGDGLPDVAIGAPHLSQPEGNQAGGANISALAGGVFLVRSEDGGTAAFWGLEPGDRLGSAIVCDQDADGDGIADLVVGAPFAGADDRGAVYVIGGADLRTLGADARSDVGNVAGSVIEGDEPDGWAGWAVAAGDLTGDGAVDLVVGQPGSDGGRGAVRVMQGATETARFAPPDDREGDHAGKSLLVGDLDRDGALDLVVGLPDWREDRAYDVGLVSVFHGARGFPAGQAVLADDDSTTIVGNQPFQRVGGALCLGALDGDGVADDLFLPTRYGGR
jgi:hypothetical protein